MHITREFARFFMAHLMQLFGDSFEARDLYTRFAGGGILLCKWLVLVLQRGGMVRRYLESNFCDCYMDEAYEES